MYYSIYDKNNNFLTTIRARKLLFDSKKIFQVDGKCYIVVEFRFHKKKAVAVRLDKHLCNSYICPVCQKGYLKAEKLEGNKFKMICECGHSELKEV